MVANNCDRIRVILFPFHAEFCRAVSGRTGHSLGAVGWPRYLDPRLLASLWSKKVEVHSHSYKQFTAHSKQYVSCVQKYEQRIGGVQEKKTG